MVFDPTDKASAPTLEAWEQTLNGFLLEQLHDPQPVFWNRWATTPETCYIMGSMAFELSVHAFLQSLPTQEKLQKIAHDILNKPVTPDEFVIWLNKGWLNQQYWFSLLTPSNRKQNDPPSSQDAT